MENTNKDFLKFKKFFYDAVKDIDLVNIIMLGNFNLGKIIKYPLKLNKRETNKNMKKLLLHLKQFKVNENYRTIIYSKETSFNETFWFEDELFRIYIVNKNCKDLIPNNENSLLFISIFSNGSVIFTFENSILKLINEEKYLMHLYNDYFSKELDERKKNIFHKNEIYWDNVNVFSKLSDAAKLNFFKNDLLKYFKTQNLVKNKIDEKYSLIEIKENIQLFINFWAAKLEHMSKTLANEITLSYYPIFYINSNIENENISLYLSNSNTLNKNYVSNFLSDLNNNKKYENILDISIWEDLIKQNKMQPYMHEITSANESFVFHYNLENAMFCSNKSFFEIILSKRNILKITWSYLYYIHSMISFANIFNNDDENRLRNKNFYLIKNAKNTLNYYNVTLKNYLANIDKSNLELAKDIKEYIYNNSQIENKLSSALIVANTYYDYLDTKNERIKAINNGILRFVIMLFTAVTTYNILYSLFKGQNYFKIFNYIVIPILIIIVLIGAFSAYWSTIKKK
ncbi:hypothetical protein [Metamycoplasma buccale]|uniref:hypothetical protein n=1 Tax=Metamycoplasma buccale TaxID=55602 RepID=UPI00398F42DB